MITQTFDFIQYEDQPICVSDELLSTASGGDGEGALVTAGVTAIKNIINGAKADSNKVDDIPVFTQKEWDESSFWWKFGYVNQGSAFYGGDPTKEHYKVVDTVKDKADYVQKIKDSNGGKSKENPGW